MALGVAIAVVPVVWGSVRHHRAEMVQEPPGARALPGTPAAAPAPVPTPAPVTVATVGAERRAHRPFDARPFEAHRLGARQAGERTGHATAPDPQPTAA